METIQTLKTLWTDQTMRVDSSMHIWESAVLLPLVKGATGWEILFEVRSANIHWQPGDICFPGGHREDTDPTLLATALKETGEELGIHADKITVLGPLQYFYAYRGPIIYPYAGILPAEEPLHIQAEEVGEVFTVPLEDLLHLTPLTGKVTMGSRREAGFPYPESQKNNTEWKPISTYPVYFYPWKNRMIWGITARVLHQFLERVKRRGAL